MAKGGARKGAGRKPGGKNQKSREIADKAAEQGITPLEVMLDAMRHMHKMAMVDGLDDIEKGSILKEAAEIAKDAAPYMHPRLAAIQHSGDPDKPIEVVSLGSTELARRLASLLTAATEQ